MARKRISPLPDIPRDTSPTLRRWMESVKEALEVRLGRRGDPGETAVTFNDLVDAGVVTSMGRINPATGVPQIGPVNGNGEDGVSLPPPAAPSGFTVVGVFGGTHLLWDRAPYQMGIVLTEIRRSPDADFSNAQLIGVSGGTSYFDIIQGQAAETFWYWARHVNANGEVGPWSQAMQASKPEDTAHIIERISGEISEDILAPAFQSRLDGFDASLNELGNQYTLSLNVDGYVTGWTLYNTGATSAFGVLADTFFIANSQGQERYPFIVDGGVTYIDEALIRDASIQEAQIGPLTIGKLEQADGTPITTVGGLIRADAIDAGNLSVAEAATFFGDVQSGNYQSGAVGWRILQNGTVEFNEGTFNGQVEFKNVTGAGALASKDSLGYSEVTGTKPPADADKTSSNTAYDTARVAGTASSTVRDQASAGESAASKVNDWVRPNTTLIDGNKIYTGDAYVDTLQIKDQAVTVPFTVYYDNSQVDNATYGSWYTVRTVTIPGGNTGGTAILLFNYATQFRDGSNFNISTMFFEIYNATSGSRIYARRRGSDLYNSFNVGGISVGYFDTKTEHLAIDVPPGGVTLQVRVAVAYSSWSGTINPSGSYLRVRHLRITSFLGQR